MDMIQRLANKVRSALLRGKVQTARIGARTLLQVTGLDGQVTQEVELLLPPGYSARPLQGADVTLHQVMGTADHVVALGGDMAGHGIPDLNPGEFGLSDGTNTVVFRSAAAAGGPCLEFSHATKVRIVAPLLECTGDIRAQCDGAWVSLPAHTHGSGSAGHTAAPDPET